jgi:protein SCO1/2
MSNLKSSRSRALVGLAAAASLCFWSGVYASDNEHEGHEHSAHEHSAHEHDAHAHHKQMMTRKGYDRSEHNYRVPDVTLIDQQGNLVALRDLLGDQEPVMLNFIFTTCTTICPVLSASFSQTQKLLGADAEDVRMISISIDPEHDTPARLREYAERFRAGEGWVFYTGDLEDVVAVQKAFDVYRGDKMNHPPVTYLRAQPDTPWIRFEGFAGAGDLVREYRVLVARESSE